MEEVRHIADLFGHLRLAKPGKVFDERATLVAFFVENLPSIPERVGMRLAHYKDMSDLYALKSMYEDRVRRNGRIPARKWFYWITKTNEV